MVTINWTEQSIDDLLNIADFIAKDSVKYSKIQIKRIKERARILRENPFLGRIVSEYGDKSMRELIIGNYWIIHKIISPERIDILTIHHSVRRLKRDKK